MTDNPEKVYELLSENPDAALCDRCVADGAGIPSWEDVGIIVCTLGLTRDFQRFQGICSVCRKSGYVTKATLPIARS
jgi:hypothetical protein